MRHFAAYHRVIPAGAGMALLALPIAVSLGAAAAVDESQGHNFFEKNIRPVMVEHCYGCHAAGAKKIKGGLLLDSRAGLRRGGDSGPALDPGNADASLLVRAVRYTDSDLQMPPKTKLSKEQVADIEKWVAMGAPDPREETTVAAARLDTGIDIEERRDFWAFRPLAAAKPKPVIHGAWPRGAVDRFVLNQLEAKGLAPAPDADARHLIRRLFYDLTGLPPTTAEVKAFAAVVSKGSPDEKRTAYAAIVDDLLRRPAFGEKWGRHWLDVARYADSNGGDRNFTFYHAWRYRNYVIDAFNNDKSYYAFVREQLAGDLMPWSTGEERRDQLVASSFLALGPKMLTERDKEKLRLDVADEQVDTLGRAFLGLTMGCARCHDHKFDPISQKDYYAMAGIMRSTEVVTGTRNGCVNVASWVEQPLPVPEDERADLEAKVARLDLVMRLAVEKVYMQKAGGKMTLDNLPLAGVLYDESDAELVGAWTESTFSDNRFGGKYIHDDRKGKGERKAIFRASLPENGTYEVRLAYNAAGNRAAEVPVRIEAWDGIHDVTLDETKRPSIGGLFEPIGRFRFEKGGRANVVIGTEGTEGYVIVDGVQFVSVRDIEREAKAVAAFESEGGDPLFRMTDTEIKKELERMVKEMKDESLAMAPRDAWDAGDIHLRVRGETARLGEKIPRGFPAVLSDGNVLEIAEGSSGRLELAEWMTRPENALLDRVMVNRIWHHLFRRGIVETVDNFGELGKRPTHPELLDHLAGEFRANGGSVKALVRELVMSRTYQLGANGGEALAAADPENELFGRQGRRRLTAEEIRDSLLFLANHLDRSRGEATASGFGEDLDNPMDFAGETLRTVYLPIARNNLAAELELFDAANPDFVTGSRPTTSVPTQGLYLLNNDFVAAQARAIGSEAASSAQSSVLAAVDALFQKMLHREPRKDEAYRAADFLVDVSGGVDGEDAEALAKACGELAHVLLASAEFLFID